MWNGSFKLPFHRLPRLYSQEFTLKGVAVKELNVTYHSKETLTIPIFWQLNLNIIIYCNILYYTILYYIIL